MDRGTGAAAAWGSSPADSGDGPPPKAAAAAAAVAAAAVARTHGAAAANPEPTNANERSDELDESRPSEDEPFDDGWPRDDEQDMPEWLLRYAQYITSTGVHERARDSAKGQKWVKMMQAFVYETAADVRQRRR